MLAASALALAAGVLAGCSSSDADADPAKTPKPSPTPTPVFTSDADALAAATKVYKEFEAVSDAIDHDGGAHPERIKPYVNAAGYQHELEEAEKMRSEHSHGVGSTVLNNVVLQSHEEHDGEAIVTIYTCDDLSHVDRIGADGRSLIDPGRGDYVAYVAVLRGSSAQHLVIQSNDYWSGGGICKF